MLAAGKAELASRIHEKLKELQGNMDIELTKMTNRNKKSRSTGKGSKAGRAGARLSNS